MGIGDGNALGLSRTSKRNVSADVVLFAFATTVAKMSRSREIGFGNGDWLSRTLDFWTIVAAMSGFRIGIHAFARSAANNGVARGAGRLRSFY